MLSNAPNSDEAAVELNDLGKSFSSFRAIDKVNLTIEKGEVFGLLGPNGAGKTTTMRIISCLLAPTDGDVLVYGKSVKDQKNRPDICREIGLLTESPNVYERLTAEQNLVFFARAYGIPEDEIDSRIKSVLEEFGLQDRRLDRAGTFSKGMKQKLAIARALIHQPTILLLDEPTASLDAESALMIRSQISETAKSGGRTVILSTHNMNDASKLCDRIAFISHGRILASGSESEVSAKVRRGMSGLRPDRVQIKLISSEGFDEDDLSKEVASVKSIHKDVDGRTVDLVFDEKYTDEEVDVLTSKAVDTLVAKGAKITSVVQSRPTLEDLYLEIVAGERREN